MSRRKILWLCSWYPDKCEPYNGDFIKRHAEAVSEFCDVHVLHIAKDTNGNITDDIKVERNEMNGLTEEIIYYYIKKNIRPLERLFSYTMYQFLYRRLIKDYIQQNGKPDLVHIHIGRKSGAIAKWVKRKIGIKYIISEHWSGFLENATERLENISRLERRNWNKLINNASGISAVSIVLAEGLKRHFSTINPIVIPNVVNTKIFSKKEEENKISTHFQFVHISGMQSLKNPILIIEAFKILVKDFPDAKLNMIGSLDDRLISYTKDNHLQSSIYFYAEMPQSELANYIRQSNALVLFSSYETFGCVIIEANACGVPVIVSDIPVFHETVQQSINGIFATAGSSESLARAMMDIALNKFLFNTQQIINETAAKYSYSVVGKQFADWYEEILKQ